MDESRFRQQLEQRNKSSKKNERKHGKKKMLIINDHET